ncbi:sensor histidine kinase [Nonomuraea sp. NN258]|nr:sensor histidine kinase [Nonomuraea antri]
MAATSDAPGWAKTAAPLALAAPLAVRRLRPRLVFAVVLVVAVAAMVGQVVEAAYLAPAYALYLVALVENDSRWIPTKAVAALALVTVVLLTIAGAPPAWTQDVGGLFMGFATLALAWTVGRAVRERRRYAERMTEQAVAEERLRIARELHDVVAHSVGVIAVKAGVANHVIHTRPEEAGDALRVIETASRNALVEMRHLLGVLRTGDAPELTPTPGLSGLDALAVRARQSGVEVELTVSVTGELPDGVELSVYRIVQEALTNVVKHAAPARCRASVTGDGRVVRVEVLDDGPGRRTLPGGGTGHGLIGMRERVMMYGGDFAAGPRPGGGFAVSATLPYRGVS